MNNDNATEACPCNSGKSHDNCCKDYLDLSQNAPTAEALMRSRYSAFVLKNKEYLRYSWHPDTCPAEIRMSDSCQWLGLKIIATKAGETGDSSGEVEFVARSKTHGKAHRLHENSRFARFDKRWVYFDGDLMAK
jgi:SEC-C motif-containing protein